MRDAFYSWMYVNGKYVGLSFLAFVLGLLAYLHIFAVVEVPKPRHEESKAPDVLVCEGEVLWVTPEVVESAREYWREYGGYTIGPLKRVPCGSLEQCEAEDHRFFPCSRRDIVVTLRDQWFKENHAGETVSVSDAKTGEVFWSTISLPSKLMASEEIGALPLPPDADKLVFTHEVGHWLGYGHAVTPIIGPFVSEPTGHMMNEELPHQGWSGEGLPRVEVP